MIVLAIVLLLLVGLVAFINTEMVLINLYLFSITIPLWLAFVGILLTGMVIASLLASAKGARNRQALKDKDKELNRSETEREEAVDRMKRDAETQMEMQKKEAEIQRLNAKLSSNQDENRPVQVRETKVEIPEENHHDRTKM